MPAEEAAQTRPSSPVWPLGLPPGSVRALVALAVVGVLVNETLAAREVSLLLSETLLVILAHYFASRRLHDPAAPVGGAIEEHSEANPLWLPRSSIRWLIIAIFAFTGLYLLLSGRWHDTAAVGNLWIVFAYLGGTAVGAWLRSRPPKDHAGTRLWQHLLALMMLLIAVLLVLASFTGHLQRLPASLEKLLMGALLFYFGSR